MGRRLTFLILGGLFACGGGASAPSSPPPATPQAATATTPPAPKPPPAPDPWTPPAGPRDTDKRETVTPPVLKTDAWAKALKSKGVPPAKPACAAYAKRAAATPKPTDLMTSLLE